MVKHQPQLAAAAQKAAAKVSVNEAGTKPSSSYIGSSKVPSSATVNGETDLEESAPLDCDAQATESGAADGLAEDQSCDQNVAKEDC